jgi:MFS family permease
MSTMQIVVVIITIALNALDGFDVLSISLAAGSIRTEFGIGPAITGLLLSMELVGMALGSIFLGRVADSWGRRPMIMSCLVMMTIGMFMPTRLESLRTGRSTSSTFRSGVSSRVWESVACWRRSTRASPNIPTPTRST